MLRPLAHVHPVARCVSLGDVAQSLKPARANGRNIVSQQLPTFLGKKNGRANLRLTEKLLLGLINITIPWKLRVYSARPVFVDELESPPSVNQISSFSLVTVTGH